MVGWRSSPIPGSGAHLAELHEMNTTIDCKPSELIL